MELTTFITVALLCFAIAVIVSTIALSSYCILWTVINLGGIIANLVDFLRVWKYRKDILLSEEEENNARTI